MKTLYVYLDSEDDELKSLYKKYIETRHLNEDSGFDLYNPTELNMTETQKVNFHVKCAFFDDKIMKPYYLYTRSGISKTNFRLANNVGIIDKGYRGDICAYIDVKRPDTLERYQRIVQLCSYDLEYFEVILVDDFEQFQNTSRGENGFGSSGK